MRPEARYGDDRLEAVRVKSCDLYPYPNDPLVAAMRPPQLLGLHGKKQNKQTFMAIL